LGSNISGPRKKRNKGFSPLNFPNLIICDKFSFIKANGIPFVPPIIDITKHIEIFERLGNDIPNTIRSNPKNWWGFYNSSNKNPVYFLLEIVWTRLEYMFGVRVEIIEDDALIDNFHSFILGKFSQIEETLGWQYFYIPASNEYLKKPIVDKKWEPVFINKAQFDVFRLFAGIDKINFKNDLEFRKILEEDGGELDAFVQGLKKTGLIDTEGDSIFLITEKCVCGISSDRKYFVGDDKTGLVTRWFQKTFQV
jgi:hypothetical protein